MKLKIDIQESNKVDKFKTNRLSGWQVFYGYDGSDKENVSDRLLKTGGNINSLDLKEYIKTYGI